MAANAKDRYERRRQELQTRRTSYDDHYTQLAEYIQPRRYRKQRSDRTKAGTKRNDKIYNGTATRASRILSSGMMAGITSPSRPWFRLTTPDPSIAERPAVKEWLDTVVTRMREVFIRSNIYNALPNMYTDLGTFHTSMCFIERDDKDIIRATVDPVGSYFLAQDHKRRINAVYREMSMSVGQIMEKFPPERGGNPSSTVRQLYNEKKYDEWIDIVHVVEPNDDQKAEREDAAGMPWRSVWYEPHGEDGALLWTGGYEEFPVMAPRWAVTGEDVYGTGGPGMDALGDIRMLQRMEARKAQILDKIVNPPMSAPAAMRRRRTSLLAGDVSYLPTGASNQKFEPAYIVDSRASQMGQEIALVEQRINGHYLADLFLMLANTAIPNMTAREVEERHEEKMLQLGPVLERLNDELLGPLIDRTFAIMMREGLIPEPPEELEGIDLKVEYISILAQAQKLLGTVGVERLVQFAMSMVEVKPEIFDKIDTDQLIDVYGELLGVDPSLIRTDKDVEKIRRDRQQEAQAAQMADQASAAKDAAMAGKAASETDLTNPSALSQMLAANGAGGGSPGVEAAV